MWKVTSSVERLGEVGGAQGACTGRHGDDKEAYETEDGSDGSESSETRSGGSGALCLEEAMNAQGGARRRNSQAGVGGMRLVRDMNDRSRNDERVSDLASGGFVGGHLEAHEQLIRCLASRRQEGERPRHAPAQ